LTQAQRLQDKGFIGQSNYNEGRLPLRHFPAVLMNKRLLIKKIVAQLSEELKII